MATPYYQFIAAYLPAAQALEAAGGPPAAYTLAQGINETGGNIGNPVIFGIKAPAGAPGAHEYKTWEVVNGQTIQTSAWFYDDPTTAFQQLGRQTLVQNAPKGSIEEYAAYLQGHGWATDPQYASKLVSIYNSIKDAVAGAPQSPSAPSTPSAGGNAQTAPDNGFLGIPGALRDASQALGLTVVRFGAIVAGLGMAAAGLYLIDKDVRK